jgi:capsular polysaccharide transport system permease protein
MNSPEHNQSASAANPIKKSVFAVFAGMNRLFIYTVVAPTLLSVFYFGLIAADVYISESRFVVRSPERQSSSPLGMLLKGAGFSRSQDDSYTVYDYILSRDALMQLEKEFNLSRAFSVPRWDIFVRFPGLDWDDSFEALFRYYRRRVGVDLDSVSSISTLTTSAFSPEHAKGMNEKLLLLSEELINRLNERGRLDMIRFAASEVVSAEKKAKAAALALSAYRNQKGVIDPERQSTIQLQQIAKLQDELIATQGQLTQLQTFTQINPQIPSLRKRVDTLRREIVDETNRVAGGDRSLANKAAEYQRLALDREFADKQLGSALVSLEQARNDAQRKQLYLERIVQPSNPDKAVEPRRIRSIVATLVLGLIAWGILTMLIAGIKEHQD